MPGYEGIRAGVHEGIKGKEVERRAHHDVTDDVTDVLLRHTRIFYLTVLFLLIFLAYV